MTQQMTEKVANMFPIILRYAISALDNENRQKIITVLEYRNRALRFNEIVRDANIKSSLLDHHLKKLEKGNIIKKRIKIEDDGGVIYYEITPFGKKLLANLLATLLPQVKFTSESQERERKPLLARGWMSESHKIPSLLYSPEASQISFSGSKYSKERVEEVAYK